MKKINIVLVICLILLFVSIVNAAVVTCCPDQCILSYSENHPACPPHPASGGADLHGWETEPLQGTCPLGQYYTACYYGGCGYLSVEYHCGGKASSGNCAGMIYETPNPSVLLSPSGEVIFNIQPAGEFQYFLLPEVGTYIVSTIDHPSGVNVTVDACDLTTTLSLPVNATNSTCFITGSGECSSAISLTPQCGFEVAPRQGTTPFNIQFSDTSNNIVNPQLAATYREWIVLDSDTLIEYPFTNPTAKDWSGYFDTPNKNYDVALTVGNVFGYCNKDLKRYINTGGNNQTGQYILTVNPDTVSPLGGFTATLSSISGNFDNVNSVLYGWEDELENANVLHDSINSNYLLQYSLISGIWYQYNLATMSYSINVGASFPTPVYSIADFQLLGVENYIINALIHKTTGENIKASANLKISNINYQILTIDAKDYLTGNLISGAQINILNINSDIWDNRSVYTGTTEYNFPYYTPLYIECEATNYITAIKNWTITQLPNYRLWMIMYRGITPPAGNVTLHVTVGDYTDGSFIQNAKVRILADGSFIGQESYTSASGTATFTTLENTIYQITVSKTGYQDGSKTINTGAGGQAIEHLIILHKLIITPTIPTPIPTIQGGGYQGQVGGNITPAYCQKIMAKGSTIVDVFKNDIACAGVTSGSNQGYIFAVIIIFVLGIAGGKYGKGMGVVMGMCAGYVVSLAMGLIPLWTFIAILIMVGLIFAIKIWSASDK